MRYSIRVTIFYGMDAGVVFVFVPKGLNKCENGKTFSCGKIATRVERR